ncbi:protein FAM180A [Embiotoca jacksoni]|uniref:protein FAM180A n=1 Tax=Embiotoca jacksoni TaxID=100190 RepID=UPI003703E5CE
MGARTNMTQRWALLAVVYLSVCQAAAQHRRKALYPSASRIKRGTYSLINPTFQRSVEDVNLLFEILLAGMQIQGEDRSLLIPDEELASLRSVEKLEVICEDVLPKRLSDIRRLTAELAQRRQPLGWQDFERTVLTLVYTTQTLAGITDQQQREVWTDSLIQLFRAVQKDLQPS